jgi:tetratricopeptide (TPR) repeat protein
MLKKIAPVLMRAMCTTQPIIFVAFMQLADAQNARNAAPGLSEFQELLKVPRSPEIAAGTVSAGSLQHRVPKEARKAYERALKTAKRDGRPDVEAAAVDLQRSITIDPEFTEALGRLGFVYFRLTRFGEAAAAYRRAIALHPESAVWHSELGWALFGLKDDAGAQECARRALRLEPANASANLLLGVLLSASAENRSESLWHLTEGSYYLQKAR